MQSIHTLRVNVKSLAAESKIISKEISKANSPEIKNCLQLHKRRKVRPESRSAQLALAAMKGMPYSKVEPKAYTEPNWNRISEKFRLHNNTDEARKSLGNWITDARQYIKNNRGKL